jgi:PIN domain nuclease of toxin-antitoxin system
MINKIVLDTCFFFCLIQGEDGQKNVEKLLTQAKNREIELIISLVNYCEILYQIKREPDYLVVRDFLDGLPLVFCKVNKEITEYASFIKSKAKISLGDAFAIGTAMHLKCPVATTDRHEFTKWEKDVDILWLR